MKKHFLLGYLMLILLSLCLCTATACFLLGGSGGGDYNPPSSMEVTVNSEHYDEEKGIFIFTYDEDVVFTKSDFTVTLNYYGDPSETVDDYSIDTSLIDNDTLKVGTYWVYVCYNYGTKEFSKSFKVTVEPAEYEIDTCDDVTVTYLGENIDLVAVLDAQLEAEGKKTLSEQTEAECIKLWFRNENERYVRKAGDYVVSAYAIKNYTSKVVDFKVTVKRAVIAPPTIKNGEIVYDGKAHVPEFEFAPGTEKFITFQNITSGSSSMNDKYTLAGTYKYRAVPRDGIVDFENDVRSVELTMTILHAPSDCNESDFKILRTEYVYKGAGQCYTVDEIEADIDTNIFKLSLSSSNVCDAGEYSLVANPIGSYLYADGTPIIRRTFPFEVVPRKEDYSARYDEIAQALVIETTYAPDTKVSDFLDTYIKDNSAFKQEVLEVMTGSWRGSCSLRKIEGDDLIAAGSSRYFIEYKPDSKNYDYSPVPVTLDVEKAVMTAGCAFAVSDNPPFVYDGKAHYYAPSVTGANAKACTVSCSIYRGDELVESAVDAGNYKAIAEISLKPEYDINYSLTVEGGTEYEWEIRRQQLGVYSEDLDFTNAEDMFEPSDKLQFNVAMKNHIGIIDIDGVTLQRNNQTVDGVLDVGNYRAGISFKVINDNYSLKNPEIYHSWQVFSTEIDLSGLNWSIEQNKVFTYGDNIKPVLVNVPSYISVSYRSNYGVTSGVLDSGNYNIMVDCNIRDYIPNADRAHIIKTPSVLSFRVGKAQLTADDFKCVYRRKDDSNFGGNYSDYIDYDETKKPKYYMSVDWYLFEIVGKEHVPEFDVVYSIVSSSTSAVSALSGGIQHRGKGTVTFTATITLKSTQNYYFTNEFGEQTFEFTCKVEVV